MAAGHDTHHPQQHHLQHHVYGHICLTFSKLDTARMFCRLLMGDIMPPKLLENAKPRSNALAYLQQRARVTSE